MNEDRQLLALIGSVYDAALDSVLWSDALRRLAAFLGGSRATLCWKDAAAKTGGVYHEGGALDPFFPQLYFEKYMAVDPLISVQVLAGIDEPTAVEDAMTHEAFRDTCLYREWMRPQGLVDSVSVALDKGPTSATMLGVLRREHDGIVDDQTRARARLIAPHVRRAAQIGRVIEGKTAEAATFADALDGLSAGMFFVDPSGTIMHANAAGHGLLESGDIVRARGGRLIASNPKADLAFRDIFRAAGDGDEEVGVRGIGMPLGEEGGERHVAHLLPLTSGARRRVGAGYAAVAALFVHKAAIETRSPMEAIARYFQLTPTELRVLLAIVDVGGVPEVAETLGISRATVKWHLDSVYQKTGASRQADLVKLVAGFTNPLLM